MEVWQGVLGLLVLAIATTLVLLPASPAKGPKVRVHYCWIGWRVDERIEWPMSIDRAHYLMREHLVCQAEWCQWKAAAFRRLVVAGRIRPDSRSEDYGR
ncbi:MULTISPECIES: hypothetical protein [unclassified Nocardia]|uniref:hypothetical protein n=1 Tax=unclassified Nocardia TaxID=2637762 RepID=UPI001CE3E38A|nr:MULTISPECIES: hypothetical protein [unclassified Nocardia]